MNASTLGQLCDRVGGTIQTGPFGSQIHQSDYRDAGVAVVMPQDIVGNRVSTERIAYIDEALAQKFRRHILSPGDIVFPRRGEISKRAFIGDDDEQFFCGTGCLKISMPPVEILPKWLFHYLGQSQVVAWIESKAVGSTMLNLNTGIMRSVPLEYPSLDVQARIVECLDAYDNLISTNQRRIALLEQAARLLYREWFVNLRFPGHEMVPVRDGLPEGWRRTTLGELCEEIPGACVQTGPFGSQLHQYDYKPEGVPVVMPQDIVGDRIRQDRIAFVDEATAARLDRHALKPLDIVFPRRGDIAKRALVEEHQSGLLCGTGCLKISLPPAPLHPLLLYFQLADPTMVKWIEGQAVGATMLNLSATILKSVSCLVPSPEAQVRFVEIVLGVRQQIDLIERAIVEAARARDLLLPKLMSGQLDVSRIPLPEGDIVAV